MKSRRGVTLIEMLMVVTLLGLLVGISFPSVTAGIETLRLKSASDSIAAFLNAALNRAERRQEVMEVSVLKSERALVLRSSEPGFERRLELPEGVSILAVLPPAPEPAGQPERPRRFILMPGGGLPRIGVEIENRRGARRVVSLDPITGVPRVTERP